MFISCVGQINIYADIRCFNAFPFWHQKNNLARPYRGYQFISGEMYPIIGRFRPNYTQFGRNLSIFSWISPETPWSSQRFAGVIWCKNIMPNDQTKLKHLRIFVGFPLKHFGNLLWRSSTNPVFDLWEFRHFSALNYWEIRHISVFSHWGFRQFCTFPLIFGILWLHLCNERSVIKLLYYRDMSNEIQFLLYNLPEDDGKV